MVARRASEVETVTFLEGTSSVEFVPSGCTVLDCVLGGGWPLGRIVNIVGDKAVGKCARDFYFLSSEGLLYSDDVGQEFADGATSINWNLALDRDRTVDATYFWKEEVSLTHRVRTRHGLELTATTDHKVMVMRSSGALEMVPMGEVREGDWLAISSGTKLFPQTRQKLSFTPTIAVRTYAEVLWPETLDPILALWLGACWADGTVSSGPLVITACKPWKRKLLSEWSEALFPGAYRMTPTGVAYSKQVRQFVEYLAGEPLRGMTARHKRVPEIVRRSPADIQAAFLRSLMDFDGYLLPTWGLSYATASKQMAREVQLMLLNFGVFAVLGTSVSKETGLEYYELGLSGRRFDEFVSLIGTHRPPRKKRGSRFHSDVESIPYGWAMLRRELENIRVREGWSRNGKLADGTRLPYLGVTPRSTDFASYDYFEECVAKLGGLASDDFRAHAARLLSWRPLFDRVVFREDVPGVQVVYDVHVPDGHLFWGSGLVNHNTLLAIEACANFHQRWSEGHIWYREVEAAFDIPYGEQMGLPVHAVDFGPEGVDTLWETVEDIFEDMGACLDKVEKAAKERTAKRVKALSKKDAADKAVITGIEAEEFRRYPGLYIVDSLDALSSRAELDRAIDKGSYGTDKAAVMSELFRRYKKRIKRANMAVIIVSQIRDRIGAMFGEKHTRTGGRALDFYASQILWLHHKGNLKSTVQGVERVTAVRIRARCKKNKMGPAHRECEFVLRFGYGTDDLEASLAYLQDVDMLDRLDLAKKDIPLFLRRASKMDRVELRALHETVMRTVREAWGEVESRFKPSQRKYG